MVSQSTYWNIGYNTLIQTSGKIISIILSIITLGILTRYLGAEGYGNFTLVFTFVASFGIISDFGTYPVYVRELSKNPNTKDSYSGTLLVLKLLLVLLAVLITVIAAFFFPYPHFIRLAIIIAALSFSFSGVMNYNNAVFQSRIRLDLVTFIDVLAKIVTVGFIIFFVQQKLGLLLLVLSVFLGNLASIIIAFILSNKIIPISFAFDKKIALTILHWSIPIGIASIFALASFRIDTLILSLMRNQHEVGVYSLAYKVLENIFVIWGYYMASVFPLLSNLQAKSREGYQKLLYNSAATAIIFSVLLIPLCFVLAPFIITFFGGKGFQESIIAFRMLLFSIPLFFLNNLFYHYYLISNRVYRLLAGLGLSFAVSVILNILFIPLYGYFASVTIILITQLILLLSMLGLVCIEQIYPLKVRKL